MKRLPETKRAQVLLREGLTGSGPFLLLRFGLYESELCRQYLEKRSGLRTDYSEKLLYRLRMDAGLVATESATFDAYAETAIAALQGVDILAHWSDVPPRRAFASFFSNRLRHIDAEDLYPYPFWHPDALPDWQSALVGKRVLLISAFAETAERQYRRRAEIWDDPQILPEFTLLTYQAPMTAGGAEEKYGDSWRGAVEIMAREVCQTDFDVALISCGAYGIPLAFELWKRGRKAIQWGGCWQLWFGIRGARWESDPSIRAYINDAWVFPTPEETPPLSSRVDGGAYWKPNTDDARV